MKGERTHCTGLGRQKSLGCPFGKVFVYVRNETDWWCVRARYIECPCRVPPSPRLRHRTIRSAHAVRVWVFACRASVCNACTRARLCGWRVKTFQECVRCRYLYNTIFRLWLWLPYFIFYAEFVSMLLYTVYRCRYSYLAHECVWNFYVVLRRDRHVGLQLTYLAIFFSRF